MNNSLLRYITQIHSYWHCCVLYFWPQHQLARLIILILILLLRMRNTFGAICPPCTYGSSLTSCALIEGPATCYIQVKSEVEKAKHSGFGVILQLNPRSNLHILDFIPYQKPVMVASLQSGVQHPSATALHTSQYTPCHMLHSNRTSDQTYLFLVFPLISLYKSQFLFVSWSCVYPYSMVFIPC